MELEQKQEKEFPKFCVFRVYPQPHLWTFETVEDAVNHLWGEDLRYYAIFKDGLIVALESNDLDEIKGRLEAE